MWWGWLLMTQRTSVQIYFRNPPLAFPDAYPTMGPCPLTISAQLPCQTLSRVSKKALASSWEISLSSLSFRAITIAPIRVSACNDRSVNGHITPGNNSMVSKELLQHSGTSITPDKKVYWIFLASISISLKRIYDFHGPSPLW